MVRSSNRPNTTKARTLIIRDQQSQLRRELEADGITNVRVLDTIENTRRDLFVPESQRERAYENTALSIGEGQTISQPYIVAAMTEALALQGHETILEIGTGCGYQAAILASLGRRIVTLERLSNLAASAKQRLDTLGFTNIEFVTGDGTLGDATWAPYDAIIVTAAAPQLPQPLYEQLKPGGRIVIPIGDKQIQRLLLIQKPHDNGKPITHTLCACRFVKLIGAAGWSE